MRKRIIGAAMVLALLALGGSMALASLVNVEQSTKTKGATTITWESGFQDLNYDLANSPTVTMTVNWSVDAGAATYHWFGLRHFTPKSRNDPATGTAPIVTYPGSNGANSVDVSFDFTGLHLDARRNVEIGNAHFKLVLMVDKDGDGAVDSEAGYGVNVHVEDPQ